MHRESLDFKEIDLGRSAAVRSNTGESFSFSFEDREFPNELSRALRQIVTERNDLIHKRLVSFDPGSATGCRELIRELDEQRARIRPQYEAISAICLGLRGALQELKDYTDSESFTDDLNLAEKYLG